MEKSTATPSHDGITLPQRMASACVGSALTSFTVTPFDVVRIRMQHQQAFPTNQKFGKISVPSMIPSGIGINACCKDVFHMPQSIKYCIVGPTEFDDCATQIAKQRRFRNTWHGLTSITRNEGFTTLWRGLDLTLLMAIPSNVVYFSMYECFRDTLPIQSNVLNPLLCGSFARMMSATVVAPIELLKTRLQSVSSTKSTTGSRPPNSALLSLRSIVSSNGITSLWRGLALTLWRDVPFSGIYWSSVETIRGQLARLEYFRSHARSEFLKAIVAGTIGGALASILTTPFDVAKTRKQLILNPKHTSMPTLMTHILRTEGISALFVGMTPRTLKVAPACCIMLSSYELFKQIFQSQIVVKSG